MLSTILAITQICFTMIIGFYFFQLSRVQKEGTGSLEKESARELAKLHRLREIKLSEPLSEKTRPTSFQEIYGQEDGLMALRAALCGANPQHVIVYGPPGVGKTAAARAALSEAAQNPLSPFGKNAHFVEVDATTLRFDDRGMADPLIGSVHDPIYQGAGAYGPGGIPQPRPGAVTRAHGGILFLDEIGELHPIQLNKLLKVLEDRRVLLESAYYSRDNKNIPRHIHDIFQNGLPADFRLVGATTRLPEEMPPALRSRCAEVFFRPLTEEHLYKIACGAIQKSGVSAAPDTIETAVQYAENGRDMVNIVQTAASFAGCTGRREIEAADILWVVQAGRYAPRQKMSCCGEDRIGTVHGLAVAGLSGGFVLDIEAVAKYEMGNGSLTVCGAVEEEHINTGQRSLVRTGTAKAAVQNAVLVLEQLTHIRAADWRLHVSFPGGYPADGPSAGIAVFAALYSAIFAKPIPDTIALTGEISSRGAILPIGGVAQKIEAAEKAGIQKIFLPVENSTAVSPVTLEGISRAEALIKALFPCG
ncbi:MAG: ATP-dependent protease LonB [Clostridia bacterium]|nr:ATP-dependent protease LonB [Clostridia bacterium]